MKKVIGFKAVIDAAKKGSLSKVFLDRNKKDHKILSILKEKNIKVEFKRLDNAIEGILKERKKDVKLDESLNTVLVLDQIQDVGNLGAILRSADAFNVDLVIIPKNSSAKVNDTVIRISAGAAANIPVLEVANLVNTMEKLKKLGFWIYGTDSHADSVNYKVKYSEKSCIVMGNENRGMRKLTRDACDYIINIPMKMESLNVSVACGIVLCERYNQE